MRPSPGTADGTVRCQTRRLCGLNSHRQSSWPVWASWPVAGLGVVACHIFAADHDDLGPPVGIDVGDWRVVGLGGLLAGVGVALLFPKVAARGRVEGEEPGVEWAFARVLAAVGARVLILHYLHVEPAAEERWAGAVAILDHQRAEILFEIPPPERVALEVESDQVPGAEKKNDQLAIGDRRRRDWVVSAEESPIGRLAPRPEHTPGVGVHTKSQATLLSLVKRGQEDPVAPDDRGRGAGAGHAAHPQDVFGLAPGGRKVGLIGRAVPEGASPVWPVCAERRRPERKKNKQTSSHASPPREAPHDADPSARSQASRQARVWPLIMGFPIAPSAAGGEDPTA